MNETQIYGANDFGDAWLLNAGGVVLVTQQQSNDSLYRELTSNVAALNDVGIAAVYRIGDAESPRMPSEAIFDGHRLARELDAANPAFALPWRRELPEHARCEVSGRRPN